jgi:hypothetical protein
MVEDVPEHLAFALLSGYCMRKDLVAIFSDLVGDLIYGSLQKLMTAGVEKASVSGRNEGSSQSGPVYSIINK